MITTKPCIKRLNEMPDEKKVPFQHCHDSRKGEGFESSESKKLKLKNNWVGSSIPVIFSSTQMQHPKSMTDTNRDDKVKAKQLKTKSIRRERCRV